MKLFTTEHIRIACNISGIKDFRRNMLLAVLDTVITEFNTVNVQSIKKRKPISDESKQRMSNLMVRKAYRLLRLFKSDKNNHFYSPVAIIYKGVLLKYRTKFYVLKQEGLKEVPRSNVNTMKIIEFI
jgi:hypothetical protein